MFALVPHPWLTQAGGEVVEASHLFGGLRLIVMVSSRAGHSSLQFGMMFVASCARSTGLNCRTRRHSLKGNIHAILLGASRLNSREFTALHWKLAGVLHDGRKSLAVSLVEDLVLCKVGKGEKHDVSIQNAKSKVEIEMNPRDVYETERSSKLNHRSSTITECQSTSTYISNSRSF